jgi:hypothetical protein
MLLNLAVRVRVKKVGRRTALTLTLSPRERGLRYFYGGYPRSEDWCCLRSSL